MASFGEWTNKMGIDYSKLNSSQQAGLAQSYGNLASVGDTASMSNPVGSMTNLDKGMYLNNAGDTTLGLDNGTWGNIGAGLNIAQGLAGLYLGNKQLGLAEDQFAFNKDMATKEYDMAKDAYDRNVKRAEGIGAQMRAGSSSQ